MVYVVVNKCHAFINIVASPPGVSLIVPLLLSSNWLFGCNCVVKNVLIHWQTFYRHCSATEVCIVIKLGISTKLLSLIDLLDRPLQ